MRKPRRCSAVLRHNMNLDDGARTQSWLLCVEPQQQRLLHDLIEMMKAFFSPPHLDSLLSSLTEKPPKIYREKHEQSLGQNLRQNYKRLLILSGIF